MTKETELVLSWVLLTLWIVWFVWQTLKKPHFQERGYDVFCFLVNLILILLSTSILGIATYIHLTKS